MALSILHLAATGEWRRHRTLLILAAAMACLPLLQLIPLPPALWTRLPGREDIALAYAVTEMGPGWSSISLTPDRTWATALGLIPPLAILLVCLCVDTNQRFQMVLVILGGLVLNLAAGALQLAGGDGFHPYPNTPPGAVSGFFVNRNHLAAFVLMSLPFAAILAAPGRHWPYSPRALRWAAVLLGLLAVVGLGAIRSRAGVILLAPALVATLALMATRAADGASRRAAQLWSAGVGLAVVAVLALGLSPLMTRFEGVGENEKRFERWPLVLEAAGEHQPLGAGLGAFDAVYRSVEPVQSLAPTFFNHAHNDYIELWLETGWPGVILLGLTAVWAARRQWRVWRQPQSRSDLMARAAGAALLLLALHSVVDFPIRTTSIMVLAALCLGLIAAAVPRSRDETAAAQGVRLRA